MDIIPEAWNTQGTIHRPNEAQEEGRRKYGYSDPPRSWNKITSGGDTETKCGADPEGKIIQRPSSNVPMNF